MVTEHFERTFVVSHTGFSNLNRDGVELPLARTGLDKLRAWLGAPFCRELWQEANHLRKDGKLTLKNFLKLYLFRVRGLKMHYWTEKLAAKLRGLADHAVFLLDELRRLCRSLVQAETPPAPLRCPGATPTTSTRNATP